MGKVQWASKQFSRYDLTITKIQKLLGLITASSVLATAIALGASGILIVLLLIASGIIMFLAYGLDKTGFQKATAEEVWQQTTSNLWWNQINTLALLYNIYGELSPEERQERLELFMERLGIQKE